MTTYLLTWNPERWQWGDIQDDIALIIEKGFIHVHHLKPLSIRKGYELNPINDLRPVCPNYHAMLHKRKPEPYTIDELKVILKTNAV